MNGYLDYSMKFINRLAIKLTKWNLCVLMLCAVLLAPCKAMAQQEITFNFNNADIRSVIKFVSNFTGRNFLVDNRVKGKVTIISPKALPADAAYQVFLSILEVNGFTAVSGQSVTKIIPLAVSRQKGIRVRFKGQPEAGDEMITQVIPLKYAQARLLVGVLRPIIATLGNITAYAPANILLVTDTAANIRRILSIIHALDVSEAVGVKLIRLKYASAEKLAKILTDMFTSKAGVAGRAAARPGLAGLSSLSASSSIKVTAYNPENMLIIVAPAASVAAINSLIEKLDLPPSVDAGLLQVRYLKNADAEAIAKVLNEMLSGVSQSQASLGAAGGAKKPKGKVLFTGKVKVVADPATNALLISADLNDRKALNKIIDKLDIRRLQVFIEALIVEVSASKAQQFGVEWRALGDFTQPGRRPVGGTSFGNQAGTNINTVAANPLAAGNGLAVGVVDGTITFGGTEFLNLAALVRALEADTNTNVLSTPNLLTMDNEEAEIVVGQNVPFVTGSSSTQGGTANPFTTIQRQDVGLTLRVTPQISEGDTVRLKIFQEISSIAPNTSGASDIITNKRSVKTVVLARDTQTIVLGGLIRNDDTESVQKVPCIGSIPILGEPFKFTELTKNKTNLMVFLKPHIINTARDIKTITQDKYLNMQDIQKSQKSDATLIFPREKQSLPEGMNPENQTPPSEKPKPKPVEPEKQAP